MGNVSMTRIDPADVAMPAGGDRGQVSLLAEDATEHALMYFVRIPVGHMGRYHFHRNSDNIWIVLEGALESIVGGVRYLTRPNEVIFMPKNVPHCTGNTRGDGEVRAIEIYAPSRGEGATRDSHAAELPAEIRDAAPGEVGP